MSHPGVPSYVFAKGFFQHVSDSHVPSVQIDVL